MKTKVFFSLMLLIISMFVCVAHTAAQYADYTQWGLPEGAKARFGKGSINEIASSPDGTRLAVASSIGIWIYDAESGEELALLTGYTDYVNSVAFSPDGNTLASGSEDVTEDDTEVATVCLWDVTSGDLIRTLTGHPSSVSSVAFSPDGKTIASISSDWWNDDYFILLWDVSTGTLKYELTEYTDYVNSVSFSPDGKTIAVGSEESTVRLWDATTGDMIRTLTGHTDYVNSVAFSPDGKTITSGSDDKTVLLWDATTGDTIRTLTGHTSDVRSVTFSPDGKTIASGSDDETVRLWDANTGEPIRTLTGHTSSVNSVAFSSDGRTIASGSDDETVRLWDASTGDPIRTLTLTGHTWGVNSVAFSPDGKTLATAGWGDSVAFSPDGKTLATTSWGTRLWDVATGDLKRTFTGHTSSVNTVRLWDVATGDPLRTLTGHTEGVNSVAFSPDGKTIASGSEDTTVRLWDATTGEPLRTLTGHTEGVLSVAFSPDGQTLASGSGSFVGASSDNTIRLWDIETAAHIQTFTTEFGFRSVAFSPDGKMIASESGWMGRIWGDSVLELWDVATGELLSTPFESGGSHRGWGVAFSPDGKTIAWGIQLADVLTSTQETTFVEHDESVSSITFSPDGNTLASGSSDGTVLLWELTPTDEPALPAADEPGNTRTDATPLPIGDSFTEKIDPGDDVDYFSIEVTEAGQLSVWTVGNLDTVGALQNSSGALLKTGDDEGEGLNFRIVHDVEPGTYYVKVRSYETATGSYTISAAFTPAPVLAVDVNGDGVVDVIDLVIVAANFGTSDATAAQGDVNGDGEVNREDILAVLDALAAQEAVGAPAAISTSESLQRWIDHAKQLNLTDTDFQKGIAVLEQLLATWGEAEAVPKETALLANYPNPFNPETWIPYQLAEPVDVSIFIYAADGKIVRTLALGHKTAGIYQNRNRAASWDGKNVLGEPVASGVYFYTLKAGDWTTTRKMLIRK